MRKTARAPLMISVVFKAFLLVGLISGYAVAQGHEPAQATAPQQHNSSQTQASDTPHPSAATTAEHPTAEQAHGTGHAEGGEDDQARMIHDMKHSPSVRWLAERLHISTAAGYWVGYILDFAILALLVFLVLRKSMPSMFRSRTASIQQGILEAQKASEEANRRLAEIESRLAKLDDELAVMQAAAQQETAAEEQRIKVAAEEDKHRIVESAESEIAAAGRMARRELKAFAAELAVSMAERRIHVDGATDQALVRSFTNQLGNDGKDGQ